jgi:hypothetical protein
MQHVEADWQQVFETTTEDVIWSSLISRGPQYAECNWEATTETQTEFARYSPNWCWSPCRRWTLAYCRPV